ncbi:MAG: DUF4398 domain-containing protein [Woeseiaceae bacterium]|nr:DUF4398 domain-containing protein [Woeseiaceae bacterium]
MPTLRSTAAFLLIAIATLAIVSACETAPPVQEMSDARQAIAVAREAGAAEKASEELEAAEASLRSAQQKLNDRDYHEARRAAMDAKLKAQSALRLAESDRDSRPE